MASLVTPWSAKASTSATFARAVGFRPLYLPAAFATAMFALAFQHDFPLPHRDARQNREHQPRGGVAGVEPLAAHAQDDKADLTFGQVGRDCQQLGGGAGQSVRLGRHHDIAGPYEGKALGQGLLREGTNNYS